MGNMNLNTAKRAKSDEFYTRFDDIQREMNCYYLYNQNFLKDKTVLLPCDDPEWSNFTKFFTLNFNRYQLKKLISTSYATDAKLNTHGKIFTLDKELPAALTFDYLEGDGDFHSEEVTKLRDEADVIITNPPFSLFREFLSWIMEADKEFLVIANKNCINYKEVFPLIMQNKIWVGAMPMGRDLLFRVPKEIEEKFVEEESESKYRVVDEKIYARSTAIWLTNLEHGRRHEPLRLMNYEDNIRYSKHKEIRGIGYPKYDNYDAIEVPYVDAIPDDYDGVMGVPITFLDKYCPEQFEILGKADAGALDEYNLAKPMISGKMKYKRLLIRHRR